MRIALVIACTVVCGLSQGFVAADAAPPVTYTSITRTESSQAIAQWNLNDSYNTSIFIVGTDGMSLSVGTRPTRGSYLVLAISQHFCDSATNEDVFREFTSVDPATPNAVSINGSASRAHLSGVFQLSGVEQRAPGCIAPDYFNRTFTYPTIEVNIDLLWTALGGNAETVSTVHSEYNDAYEHYTIDSVSRGGFSEAAVVGTVVSQDAEITWGLLNDPVLAFVTGDASTMIQIYQVKPF